MKRDLVSGWVFTAMALLVVFCIVVNCIANNWGALPICIFTFSLNIYYAYNHFRDYKRRKEYEASWN